MPGWRPARTSGSDRTAPPPARTTSAPRPRWRCSPAAATRSTRRWRPASCCRSSSRTCAGPAARCRPCSSPRPTRRRGCCAGRACCRRRRASSGCATSSGWRSCPAPGCSPPPCPAPGTAGSPCCATTARCALADVLDPALGYAAGGFPPGPAGPARRSPRWPSTSGRTGRARRRPGCRDGRAPGARAPAAGARRDLDRGCWRSRPAAGRPGSGRSTRPGTPGTAGSSPRRSTTFCRIAGARRHRPRPRRPAHRRRPRRLVGELRGRAVAAAGEGWAVAKPGPVVAGAGAGPAAALLDGAAELPGRRRHRGHRAPGRRGRQARVRRPGGLVRRQRAGAPVRTCSPRPTPPRDGR